MGYVSLEEMDAPAQVMIVGDGLTLKLEKNMLLWGSITELELLIFQVQKEPQYLGKIPTATEIVLGEIQGYKDHAVVSEADGHGLQIFDLTKLRGVRI